MQVRMTARHSHLNNATKQLIQQRSEGFTRFFDNIIDCHWVLDQDRHLHTAETTAVVHGTLLRGHGEGDDLRTAIDNASAKMEAQLKKYKGRLKDKDPKAITEAKKSAARTVGPRNQKE